MGSSQLVLSFQQYLTARIGLDGETPNDNDQYFSDHKHSCIHGLLADDWELEVFSLPHLIILMKTVAEGNGLVG